jgi:Zn-dependent protease with chaperone function
MSTPYAVVYFPDPEPKVFAKGGKIHISSGMVRRITGPELQAVILHETGHMELEHSIDKFGLHLVAVLLFVVVALVVVSPSLKAVLLGAILATWAYAREWLYHWCEFDADAYVVRAGYGKQFAAFLCKTVRDHDQRTFSHPSVMDRILRIYEKA